MKYIKRLDSLRAFAVVLVIISHWTNVLEKFELGAIGVDVFFVLSGFLITGILLDAKTGADNSNEKRVIVYKNFVIRRALRIFPLYYTIVIIIYVLSKYSGTKIHENIFYYLTYTSNILFFIQSRFDGILSHLWSLAVEEQFYLFWPILILIVPAKRLNLLFVITIIAGIVFRYVLLFNHTSFAYIRLLTPSCFDAFGGGALLAYFVQKKKSEMGNGKLNIVLMMSVIAFALLVIILLNGNEYFRLLSRTLVVIITCSLIVLCLKQEKKNTKGILSIPALMWIGKISYGLYIYHMFIPWLFGEIIHKFKIPVLEYLISNVPLLVYSLTLVIIATFSFYYFERPITKLKDRFKYY